MYQSFVIEQLRKENPNFIPKTPFEHQKDAFVNLSALFTFPGSGHKSGILVLPTGAGKTFTSVNWICKNVLPKNIKVIWLAHTSHLLEQAYETFTENLLETHGRDRINMRIVSSNPVHSNPSSIELTDDIVIITTQSSISNWNTTALDGRGNKQSTSLEKYITYSKQTGLFVVLDEAHHAPAYGCRNFLVGGKDKQGIRNIVPNAYFLGLTATPTYTDVRRRGWLFEIFQTEQFDKKGIIYEVDKADLTRQGILAATKYIQRNTGKEFEVDDRLYNRVVREHNDLPEELVNILATDSGRNDYIVNEYITNKERYCKTIIFTDRWFQCVYIKEKLKEKGVRVDAIFSHVDTTQNSSEQRNGISTVDNADILKQFKNNKLDVLINVKMLTEGTDVPDVNTVFITRETTSSILITQMMGRALRGKRAGGGEDKEFANIVFFVDNWKRIIFNPPGPIGGSEENDEPKVKGHYPLQYISIRLMEELSRMTDSGVVFAVKEYLEQIPVGWYETEAIINVEGEMSKFREFVIVYENTQQKFSKFIEVISAKDQLSPVWENESLSIESVQPEVEDWIKMYFDAAQDNADKTLDLDIIRIARHIAQSSMPAMPAKPPVFYTFKERDKHNLSKLAFETVQKRLDDLTIHKMLHIEFHSSDKLWELFYKSYNRFSTAFDAERQRAIHKILYNSEPVINVPQPKILENSRELSSETKENVFRRDSYRCLCCGKTKSEGKRVKFEIDHIIPVKFGGQTNFDNSQTLCSICNKTKGINEINFTVYKTPLSSPKESLKFFDVSKSEFIDNQLQRIINFFYHCQAVASLKLSAHKKSSCNWEIQLHEGNDPEWLNKHKEKLIEYIHGKWKCESLKELTIR